MAETTLFMENFYILDDGRVRQFLITGESGQSSIMINNNQSGKE